MIPEVNKPNVVYQCDGINKRWLWPYDFHRIEDIQLIIVDADGKESVQTGNIDYNKESKVITFPAVGAALDNTNKVILERRTPISQTADLPDEYPFENIERMTDKVTLILQEMQEKMGRALLIRVDSDENPTEVARKIVDTSVKAANDAINAYEKIKGESEHINADAEIIKTLGGQITELGRTVDDKLATANAALDTSTANINKANQMATDTKTYAAKVEVDKRDISNLVANAKTYRDEIASKQATTNINANRAEDAAKKAQIAADKAVEIALPNGQGVITKSEANATFMNKSSLGGIVSVMDFGAKGDGVTDDTAAFKKANDNLANKILYVPTGTYKLSEHMSFNTVSRVIDNGTYPNIKPFYPVETPMLKGASNIAFVKNITYDDEVNQCQGFTFNSKKNVFVLACISGDGTKQIIYELDPITFEKTGTYKYSDPDRMGHCNTMTYNPYTNKIYLANGLKNGNNLTVLNADTMQYESTITLKERVFNIDYDPITHTYVSIVPISGNQRVREVNLYSDDFKKFKTYQIDYQYEDYNNNGAFMLNGAIMSATLGSLVECTPFGKVKQIIEINKTTEIEDIAYYNDKFYFAVLTQKADKRHQVDIYVGDPNYDFENSINTQRLKNLDYLKTSGGNVSGAIVLNNNVLLEGKKTDGHGIRIGKVSTSDAVELGDPSAPVFATGTTFKHYDGTDSYTVITTKHLDNEVYRKNTIDKTFVKKDEAAMLGFPYQKLNESKDWNTLTEQGCFEINFDGGANNPPRSHKQGMLIVMNFGDGACIDQTLHAFNGETYHRMFMAGTWKSWGRVQTSLNSRLKLWSANGGAEVYVE